MLALQTRNEAEFIHPEDPALNTAAEGFDWENFCNTGDRSTLHLHDGQLPTVFKVRKLTRKQYEHVKRQTSEPDLVREAVVYALHRVDNYKQPGEMELGTKQTDLGKRLTDASYEEIFVPSVLLPLALFILNLSNLNPSKGQR
jgi:hypothetical protein